MRQEGVVKKIWSDADRQEDAPKRTLSVSPAGYEDHEAYGRKQEGVWSGEEGEQRGHACAAEVERAATGRTGEEINGRHAERNDGEVNECGGGKVQGLGVVNREEDEGYGEKQEQSGKGLGVVELADLPEKEEDGEEKEVSDEHENGEVEMADETKLGGDDQVFEDELVVDVLEGSDVEEFGWEGGKALVGEREADDGRVVVQGRDAHGEVKQDPVGKYDGAEEDGEQQGEIMRSGPAKPLVGHEKLLHGGRLLERFSVRDPGLDEYVGGGDQNAEAV